MATSPDMASPLVIQTGTSPSWRTTCDGMASGQAAALMNQCPDLCFGDRTCHDGLPRVLQSAFPCDQPATHVAISSLVACGSVLDLGVQFGDDNSAVDWGFAGIHRVEYAPIAGYTRD